MSFDAGWRGRFAALALAFSLFIPVFLAVSALLTKYGVVDYKMGFGFLTLQIGSMLSLVGLALSALAIGIALFKAPRKKAFIVAIAAMIISATIAGRAYFTVKSGLMFPPIHDIQTNWADPIQPSAYLVELRTKTPDVNPIENEPVISEDAASRWPEFVGQSVAQVQEQSELAEGAFRKSGTKKPYPSISTLSLNKNASEMFDIALVAINQNGWDIVPAAHKDGRIEATVTSPWFGFKDDVMIRIQADGDGTSTVDIRSVSRVGLSDLGANAKRVDDLSRQLRRLSGDASFN